MCCTNVHIHKHTKTFMDLKIKLLSTPSYCQKRAVICLSLDSQPQQGEAVEAPGRHVPRPPGRVTAGHRLQAARQPPRCDDTGSTRWRLQTNRTCVSARPQAVVDAQTLDSRDRLTQVNLCLRSLWSSTTMVLKP